MCVLRGGVVESREGRGGRESCQLDGRAAESSSVALPSLCQCQSVVVRPLPCSRVISVVRFPRCFGYSLLFGKLNIVVLHRVISLVYYNH